jgi:hypothetical protein
VRTHALSLRHLRVLNKRHRLGLTESGSDSIQETLLRGLSEQPAFLAKQFNRRGTFVYHPATKVDRLIQCVVNDSITSSRPIKQSNRNEIVSNLVLLMQEPCDFRLYRFDIKRFYESIDRGRVLDDLRRMPDIPGTSARILAGIFEFCKTTGIEGVPRGVPVSATLAEHYLQTFDATIRALPDVFFYARFVDDILIMTSRLEDPAALHGSVEQGLRTLGLDLHPTKLSRLDFDQPGDSFEYLGYSFELIEKSTHHRAVRVDMAEAKVKRFKTRVVRSLLAHTKTRDFDLLRERIEVLTGNYVVNRRNEHQALRAGMYYSYPHLTHPDATQGALRQLDLFLLRALTSKRLHHSRSAGSLLSRVQRTQLVKMSFRIGHKNRLVVDCAPQRLEEITRIWMHA